MSMPPDQSIFDTYYYAHKCDHEYVRDETWLNFFGRIASRIVEELNPRTVLDTGGDRGFLAEKLGDQGVEAWGVDISEYAISQVYGTMKPYCKVASLTEPCGQKCSLPHRSLTAMYTNADLRKINVQWDQRVQELESDHPKREAVEPEGASW